MPTVEIDPEELKKLARAEEKSREELKEDLFSLGLEYEGSTEEGEFELEFAPDRLERLSIEGIARSLRQHYGTEKGIYVPATKKGELEIKIEESVPEERPYVTGAIIKNVDLNEKALESLIQLQEKLHATMGRNRVKGAIGIHDLDSITAKDKTVYYTGIKPEEDSFNPLESEDQMTPEKVVSEHPKGREYSNIVKDYERFPAIYDDESLFSLPPIINGRRTEVSTDSNNLFVELTGTDQWTIDRMCNIICHALEFRGGTIEKISINYADKEVKERPIMEPDTKNVEHSRIESTLGIDIAQEDVLELAERSGLKAEIKDEDPVEYKVKVPPYRVDVLHPSDIVDDIGRAYGFNDLEPRYPDIGTIGGRSEATRLEDTLRNTLIGLGFTDLLNFHMTSKENNFEKMNLEPGGDALGVAEPVEIEEPYSRDYEALRTWALPSLMTVLENNAHRKYPQNLAEIGLRANADTKEETNVKEERTVAAVMAYDGVSYEDIRSKLEALAERFGKNLETSRTEHPSFIDGRTAKIVIDGEEAGVIGEIHPEVILNHDIEVPVAGFELSLDSFKEM